MSQLLLLINTFYHDPVGWLTRVSGSLVVGEAGWVGRGRVVLGSGDGRGGDFCGRHRTVDKSAYIFTGYQNKRLMSAQRFLPRTQPEAA